MFHTRRALFQVVRAGTNGNESYPNYLDLRDRNSFDALAAAAFAHDGLDTGDGAEGAWGFATSGNYFDVPGVQPYLGRLFHASDEHGPNSAPYVVLSYAYWQNHFHGNRDVLGRTVLLSKHPLTIIGVTQPGFLGTFTVFFADFFVPIVNEWTKLTDRGSRGIDVMFGRVKPGVTPAQAVADLNATGADLEKTYPKENGQMTFELGRLGLADAVKPFLGALMFLAGLILVAACANLGSLFAARAADRSKEVALRLALGSTRKRVLRGLFSEATLISLMGDGVGLWASVVLLHTLKGRQPFPEFPINIPITPDTKVYLVALLLTRERFSARGCPCAAGAAYGSVSNHQVGNFGQWCTPVYGTRSFARSTDCYLRGTRDFVAGCGSGFSSIAA